MDYVYIYDDHNNKRKMEVVSTFSVEEYPFKYIIYKELDDSKYYLAKYRENSKDLDTNLTDNEIRVCSYIFEGLIQ